MSKKKPNIPGIRGRIKAVAFEHIANPGVYVMNVQHEDWCRTLITQDVNDCVCRDPWVKAPTKIEPISEDQ